ncbi:DUF1330 domain-containing protein [Sphingomicrobium sediminis]|uniref:DUF1330 domain-containing protein n=1 Tax=Sphingomicrobium sediminis TaxID=2950949 RepID=A0A9X2EKA4_9SPHN|nr:DUF1330 domain-containing protein [Sphingomicrobium sediminis]MCM8556907.1 DUF1330 domain-containing protein [Sphingomicrobium sediminis]
MPTYLEPTEASATAFFMLGIKGPVVMLNLLRFREVADYSDLPDLAPDTPISGAEAYDRYMAHTAPFLLEAGGKLLFDGEGGRYFIGPEAEHWDRVLLVEQASPEAFMAFAQNKAYLSGIGHRSAALADSRLLPIVPQGV